MKHEVRLATADDCGGILRIYSYYVEHTPISFETEVPSPNDFCRRIESISETYPYLVYVVGGEIAGYAYASRHRERAAYLYDVEVSVYVLAEYHGRGVAAALYDCLLRILREQGFYNVYAGITIPNEKSRRFHEKFGFTEIGVYHKTGYKHGKWLDVVWMEKAIGEHGDNPPRIKLIGELDRDFLSGVFAAHERD